LFQALTDQDIEDNGIGSILSVAKLAKIKIIELSSFFRKMIFSMNLKNDKTIGKNFVAKNSSRDCDQGMTRNSVNALGQARFFRIVL